ncbi:ABC transporter substrate-binding protein [Ihubacter sp. mB4P-1]|uniref:ABC transporter substrate-binding protein n=1 Tax=Ihubacter sp. mB4P-1 TaxID=3242370 RepID=UPI0013794AEC
MLKKQKKFTAILLIMLLAAVTLMSGCGGGGNDSSEGEGSKTLVIAVQDEVEGTDIQQIGWTNVVHELIYSPLVTYSKDLEEILPCFAESYEISEDGLSITFHLFADSKFSNGDPLTAESVKKSVLRMKEISEYSGDVEAIKDIEVVDDTTLIYHLSEPAAYMWASLCSDFGGVVDVDKAEEMGKDEYNRCAVTNGMYMVKDWQAGSQIILEKNPNFKTANPNVENKELANFDEIIVRFIPDEFTRVSELESGNIDIAYNIPAANREDLKSNQDITTYEYEQAGVSYLMMNTDTAPLDDMKVRQAINLAIDKDALAESMNNVIAPTYGFISKAQAGYSEEKEAALAELYKFDQEKAKALLKEAGYEDKDGDGFVEKDGKKLTFEFCSSTDRATAKASAPVLQDQLKQVGIDVEIREYEGPYIKQLMRENNYQSASRNFEWVDADILYYVFTEASGYPWHDETVTKKLEEARYITDAEKRVKKYEEFHDAIFAQMPAVSLFADIECIATRSNIKGFAVTNDGRSLFNDTVKE